MTRAECEKNSIKARKTKSNESPLLLSVSIIFLCLILSIALFVMNVQSYAKLFGVSRNKHVYSTCNNCKNVSLLKHSLNQILTLNLKRNLKDGNIPKESTPYLNNGEARRYLTSKKLCAHLIGGSVKSTTHQQMRLKEYIMEWNANHHTSFLKNGMKFRNDRLIIPLGGTYHVYSQMHFNNHNASPHNSSVDSSVSWRWSSTTFSHRIYRYNIRYPNTKHQKLLDSTDWSPSRRPYNALASHLGATLYLRPGDELFVKVSGELYAPAMPYANNFGIFQV